MHTISLLKQSFTNHKFTITWISSLIGGLISCVREGKKTIYLLSSADAITTYFEEKEKEILLKKEKSKQLAQEIKHKIKLHNQSTHAELYKGVPAIKEYLRKSVEKEKQYCAFGAPKESVSIMGDYFWKNHAKRLAENNVSGRMIFNESLREFSKVHDDKITEIKFFEGFFEPLTEVIIQGDEIATIIWKDDPVMFVLEEENTANAYRTYFEYLWERSREQ